MGSANSADRDLARKCHIPIILQHHALRVGFEAEHRQFAIINLEGEYVGFDINFGRRLAETMGVNFVPVNTASEGLVPTLLANKIDIIMCRMTNLKVTITGSSFEY